MNKKHYGMLLPALILLIGCSSNKNEGITTEQESIAKSSSEILQKEEDLPEEKEEREIVEVDTIESEVEKEEKTIASSEESTETETNEIKEINDLLVRYIEENQGFALGTLDGDGNPTDNGTPDDFFAPWLIIRSIEYTGSDIQANVTADFVSFTTQEKDSLASSIQNAVGVFTSDFSLHVYVYNGENALGHSKLLDSRSYTWY
ncbi:hypothetical protein A5886_001847 [Enterococcus sp. 8G7_MSG3316]|uniref:Uncharacterized protein n=1 Tax=Candidatus Enterococcus testudinis TaxID=1834191 RepID=A0A242A6V9_9ENTE|nr:hypothetical protein [Enterococcus sp. 8G7_MSG3316]OTN76768.1 hypothetical protein A5886_001847 [Enterococcus sp. 8G7_MSG3316]